MSRAEKPYLIVGVIDSYGAIHSIAVKTGDQAYHESQWPTAKKRWRFLISEWQLTKSPFSEMDITPEEAEAVIAHVRKKVKPPLWVVEGEEWEAAGRVRSGPKWEALNKKRESRRRRSKSTLTSKSGFAPSLLLNGISVRQQSQ